MWIGNNYNYKPYTCQMNMIYKYLGKYIYEILSEVELPEGHITLNTSILLLIKGYDLPEGHLSLEEMLKEALNKE